MEKNVINFKASAFLVERVSSSFNYEIKGVRALWDPSLSVPGTNRRGGWRCPVGTRYGGQITDRFGRQCGWGVARRIANQISSIGQRLENIDDRKRGNRLERRNARVMRHLRRDSGGGRIERGLRGVADVLDGGETPSIPSTTVDVPEVRKPNWFQRVMAEFRDPENGWLEVRDALKRDLNRFGFKFKPRDLSSPDDLSSSLADDESFTKFFNELDDKQLMAVKLGLKIGFTDTDATMRPNKDAMARLDAELERRGLPTDLDEIKDIVGSEEAEIDGELAVDFMNLFFGDEDSVPEVAPSPTAPERGRSRRRRVSAESASRSASRRPTEDDVPVAPSARPARPSRRVKPSKPETAPTPETDVSEVAPKPKKPRRRGNLRDSEARRMEREIAEPGAPRTGEAPPRPVLPEAPPARPARPARPAVNVRRIPPVRPKGKDRPPAPPAPLARPQAPDAPQTEFRPNRFFEKYPNRQEIEPMLARWQNTIDVTIADDNRVWNGGGKQLARGNYIEQIRNRQQELNRNKRNLQTAIEAYDRGKSDPRQASNLANNVLLAHASLKRNENMLTNLRALKSEIENEDGSFSLPNTPAIPPGVPPIAPARPRIPSQPPARPQIPVAPVAPLASEVIPDDKIVPDVDAGGKAPRRIGRVKQLDDAVKALHENQGNLADIPDGIVIDAVVDGEFRDVGGNRVLTDAEVASELKNGFNLRRRGSKFENRRYKFEVKKNAAGVADVWVVLEVQDKITGEKWFMKSSTFGANDALLENVGMNAAQALEFGNNENHLRIGEILQNDPRINGAPPKPRRWIMMKDIAQWENGVQGNWAEAGSGLRAQAADINPRDVGRILALDMVFDNQDRHDQNFMWAREGNRVRLGLIDHGLIGGGRQGDTSDREAWARRIIADPSARKYANSANNGIEGLQGVGYKVRNERDARILKETIKRSVARLKRDLDKITGYDRIEANGVRLSDAEKTHLALVKSVAEARIGWMENNLDAMVDFLR